MTTDKDFPLKIVGLEARQIRLVPIRVAYLEESNRKKLHVFVTHYGIIIYDNNMSIRTLSIYGNRHVFDRTLLCTLIERLSNCVNL